MPREDNIVQAQKSTYQTYNFARDSAASTGTDKMKRTPCPHWHWLNATVEVLTLWKSQIVNRMWQAEVPNIPLHSPCNLLCQISNYSENNLLASTGLGLNLVLGSLHNIRVSAEDGGQRGNRASWCNRLQVCIECVHHGDAGRDLQSSDIILVGDKSAIRTWTCLKGRYYLGKVTSLYDGGQNDWTKGNGWPSLEGTQ